ncbi:hypothetical protein BVRB_6g154270 [Beta vulgaris subsp. vulgaris]|nr:hypothetical protein BVRB_6g154270 [Beta vulgaris subsp. vulgaris]
MDCTSVTSPVVEFIHSACESPCRIMRKHMIAANTMLSSLTPVQEGGY